MQIRRPTVHAVLVAALLVALVSVGAGVAGGALGGLDAATAAQDTNNTTTPTPHENPDQADGDGDDDRVAQYLSSQLAARLGDSTREISQGEYERGRALLGDDYDDVLDKYVTVAGDTGNEDTAEELNETRSEQEEFADRREEFAETREEYEDAVEAGNESRARELARELQSQATELEQLNESLTTRYTTLEDDLGTDLSEPRANIANSTQEAVTQADEIAAAQLVGTTLTVTSESETATFTDPATITGTLRTEAGDPVANESITLTVGEHQYTTTTDAQGRFTVTYRPVTIPLNGDAVAVSFEPTGESPYLRSETSLPLTVPEQTPSTVSITNSTTTVSFNDTVSAAGTVTVANRTVSGLPVELRVDGRLLGTTTTDADGHYAVSGRLPDTVASGNQSLTVSVPLENAAVAGSRATTSTTVEPTQTQLTVSANATGTTDTRIDLQGALQTVSSTGLADQQLAVFVDGTRLATMDTGPTGTFDSSVPVPDAYGAGDQLELRIAYDGTGTNLDSVSETVTVSIPAATGTDQEGFFQQSSGTDQQGILQQRSTPVVAAVVLLIALGLLVASSVLYVRRDRLGTLPVIGAILAGDQAAPTSDASTSTADATETHTSSPHESAVTTAFRRAESALDAGEYATAVTLAYGAVRTSLTHDHDETAGLHTATHWEFFARLADDRPGLDAFRSLTEAFEQAAFANQSVDETTAANAVAAASQIIDR